MPEEGGGVRGAELSRCCLVGGRCNGLWPRVCFRSAAKPMPRLESCAWSCSCTARGRHKHQLGDAAAGLAAKVGDMLSSSVASPSLTLAGPGARGPSTSSATSSTLNLSHHLVQRSVVLFVVGAFMALVLNLLQIQRNVTLFPDEVISTLFSSAWWVPPCCGTAAGEFLTSTSDSSHPPVGRRGGGAELVTCVRGRLALPPPAVSDANLGFWKGACPLWLCPRVSRVSEGFLFFFCIFFFFFRPGAH